MVILIVSSLFTGGRDPLIRLVSEAAEVAGQTKWRNLAKAEAAWGWGRRRERTMPHPHHKHHLAI